MCNGSSGHEQIDNIPVLVRQKLIEQQEGCRVIDNLKDSSKDVGLK
jgi:hypothetical protein